MGRGGPMGGRMGFNGPPMMRGRGMMRGGPMRGMGGPPRGMGPPRGGMLSRGGGPPTRGRYPPSGPQQSNGKLLCIKFMF